MKNIKKALLLTITLMTGAFAGFDFGECSGSVHLAKDRSLTFTGLG